MSALKRVALVITVLLLALVGAAAWMLRSRAEEIPTELPPTDIDPMSVVIPGSGGLPDLKLADYKGKTIYLILGDRESMEAREGKEFDRALNRWTYPPDVVGFAIGDAEGFKLLSGKIEEMLGAMRPEMRLPLYIDFDGAITKAFKLPKGHTGIVVLGPDGALKLRHSGPPKPEDDIIARLKLALRAEEPVLPPAPPFKVGTLDNAACAGKTCLFVFLAVPVKKSELPGVEGGFDGGMEESMKLLQNPSIRLAGLAHDLNDKLDKLDKPEKLAKDSDKPLADKVLPTLIGAVEGVELKHWKTLPDAPEARAAFDIPGDQAALIAIDPEGHLALRELGVIPMYKLGRISELLDIDLGDRSK